MPTSATGAAEAGFTLVELLIVLVLVGLVSAVAVVAMPDPRGRVEDEAERFAARAAAAADAAVISGRPVRLTVDAAGYAFEERAGGGWRAPADPRLARRTWGGGAAATVEGGRARTIFDPAGAADPLAVTLARDDATAEVTITADGRADAR